ncbi:VPA1269 family protein [Ruegeria sp. 2012CJ41-6]|uniref:VPA1269 family protein n=1 Tax=Ruegeria spongiae TaxID=2942209 RepID=A0ABT0Q498_9RHOB|nr:VPA1269 family protein [Ruegeria spongiae]MCL6284267.1 VPA1269 family protein [Ruegeria spongiae]
MTEQYKYSTLKVEVFDGVRVNTSETQVWVKEDLGRWRSLFLKWSKEGENERAETALYNANLRAGKENKQVNSSAKTRQHDLYTGWKWESIAELCELLSIKEVQAFFEAIVEEQANSKTKAALYRSNQSIRKFLDEALGKTLVLLPMTRRGQLKWHPYNPTIRRDTQLADSVDQAFSGWTDGRLNSVAASFFNYTDMKQASQLTEEFCKSYYHTPFVKALPTNRTSLYNKTLEAIASVAREQDPNYFAPALTRDAYVVKRKLTDTDFWWLTDASKGGAPEWATWQEMATQWLANVSDKKLDGKVNAITHFVSFLRENSKEILNPRLVHRQDIAEVNYSEEPNFISWLEDNVAQEPSYKTTTALHQFFAHVEKEYRYEEPDAAFLNPVHESDSQRFFSSSTNRGKSNKNPLPSEIIQMAIEVITEDDFAFPKSFKNQHIRSIYTGRGEREDVWCPVVATALLTLLTLPIRTLQACLLDSGEADEFLVDTDGELVKNRHPLAQKGREVGCLRTFPGRLGSDSFVGFFINTNKTAVKQSGELETGYEIPWCEERLIKQLHRLRDWQINNNPVPAMLARSELKDKSQRVNSTLPNQPKYTFLFRDATSATNKLLPITSAKITAFWGHVCLEVQNRLEKLGQSVQLVRWTGKKGRRAEPHPLYTLHSLRVSGITNFIEHGVPIHVISEFVSGHAQLIMTLYYTKLNPGAIRDKLDLAYENMRSVSEEDFFDKLEEMSDRFLENQSEGSPGKRTLLESEPGFWSFDIDGVCPVGRSNCSSGRLNGHSENGKPVFGAIVPDGFNCSQCRFWLTGPDFLVGQATMFNNLLYVIRERSAEREKILEKVDEQRNSGNTRKAKILGEQLKKIEDELTDKVTSLGTRLERFYASKQLKSDNKNRASSEQSSHAMLTSMSADELQIVLEETKSWELVEFAAQSFEFFPHIPVSSARFRKQLLLEQMAQRNGLKPLFLHLSDDEAQTAANKLTDLLTKSVGREALNSLMSGEQSLLELGLIGDFEIAVGDAIPTPSLLTRTISLLEVASGD